MALVALTPLLQSMAVMDCCASQRAILTLFSFAQAIITMDLSGTLARHGFVTGSMGPTTSIIARDTGRLDLPP